jgi:hypothetical protein
MEKENVQKTKNFAVVGTGSVTERKVTTNRFVQRQQKSLVFFFILVHGPYILEDSIIKRACETKMSKSYIIPRKIDFGLRIKIFFISVNKTILLSPGQT